LAIISVFALDPCPSRRAAASLSGLLLVASYFITTLAHVSTDLAALAKFSPLNYYQGGDALNGLNVDWLARLLIASIVFMAIALWRFQRRDIRVFGEGSWSLRFSRKGAKPRSN
jgi:ABC-2 type transport system permease protein